jgi:hypothetical protein
MTPPWVKRGFLFLVYPKTRKTARRRGPVKKAAGVTLTNIFIEPSNWVTLKAAGTTPTTKQFTLTGFYSDGSSANLTSGATWYLETASGKSPPVTTLQSGLLSVGSTETVTDFTLRATVAGFDAWARAALTVEAANASSHTAAMNITPKKIIFDGNTAPTALTKSVTVENTGINQAVNITALKFAFTPTTVKWIAGPPATPAIKVDNGKANPVAITLVPTTPKAGSSPTINLPIQLRPAEVTVTGTAGSASPADTLVVEVKNPLAFYLNSLAGLASSPDVVQFDTSANITVDDFETIAKTVNAAKKYIVLDFTQGCSIETLDSVAGNRLKSAYITGIKLPACKIGEKAFMGNIYLRTVDLSSVTSIGNSAFEDCTGIVVPVSSNGTIGILDMDKVTAIGDRAFASCTGITGRVKLGAVTSIGARAFYNCLNSGFTKVEFPSTVTSIRESAFAYTYLVEVKFNANTKVTAFGENAVPDNNVIAGGNGLRTEYLKAVRINESLQKDTTFKKNNDGLANSWNTPSASARYGLARCSGLWRRVFPPGFLKQNAPSRPYIVIAPRMERQYTITMEKMMSTFNETITLTNTRDEGYARDGFIPQSKVRTITVDACVDTGSWNLVINEKVRARLGLTLKGSGFSTLADGTTAEYSLTEPVTFRWKDREFTLNAQLIPTADEVLFGALPMESLDLMPDPVAERLIGRHGDKPLHRLK